MIQFLPDNTPAALGRDRAVWGWARAEPFIFGADTCASWRR